MSIKRKIAVVTGSRAEYGLLFHTIKKLAASADVDLSIIATGTHLSPFYAHTVDEIKADGFKVERCVDLLIDGDSSVAIAKSVGIGVIGFADAFQQLQPDLVVLLGDRFEILAAAQAAFFLKIPIAHLHGGEVTTGALDDSIRHAVTKFSSLHFVSTECYRQRVIQMGEDPRTVFNVGAPGLENFKCCDLMSKAEFEREYDFTLGEINFLVAYHPATATNENSSSVAENIMNALLTYEKSKIIITGSNADEAGRSLTQKLQSYQVQYTDRVLFQMTLGQRGYLSALTLCDVMIGNSSSGIIEAPTAGTPSINIGYRQQGRVRSPSVIDCADDQCSIAAAVLQALSPAFKKIAMKKISPYAGKGLNISDLIYRELISYPLTALKEKKFYDIEHEVEHAVF